MVSSNQHVWDHVVRDTRVWTAETSCGCDWVKQERRSSECLTPTTYYRHIQTLQCVRATLAAAIRAFQLADRNIHIVVFHQLVSSYSGMLNGVRENSMRTESKSKTEQSFRDPENLRCSFSLPVFPPFSPQFEAETCVTDVCHIFTAISEDESRCHSVGWLFSCQSVKWFVRPLTRSGLRFWSVALPPRSRRWLQAGRRWWASQRSWGRRLARLWGAAGGDCGTAGIGADRIPACSAPAGPRSPKSQADMKTGEDVSFTCVAPLQQHLTKVTPTIRA